MRVLTMSEGNSIERDKCWVGINREDTPCMNAYARVSMRAEVQGTFGVDVDAAKLVIRDDHKCMAVRRTRRGRVAKDGHIRAACAMHNNTLQASDLESVRMYASVSGQLCMRLGWHACVP